MARGRTIVNVLRSPWRESAVRSTRLVVAGTLALVLVSCGGGGAGPPPAAPSPGPAPVPPPPQVGAGVKWHPGQYVESDMADGISHGWSIASAKSEIDSAFANPNVLGYQMMVTWAVVERDRGAYNFSDIDVLRSYIATRYPDRRFSVLFLLEDPFQPDPARAVPPYILADPGFGPPGPNGQFGYVQLKMAGRAASTAAWYRASVAERIIALMQAYAAHPSPYGGGDYTYDSDPYFEAVVFDVENAMEFDGTPSDFSPAQAVAQWEAIAKAAVAAWPHTNVLDTNNWLGIGNSEADVGAVMVADGNEGVSLSGPDIMVSQAYWTWGQLTYTGNSGHSGYGTSQIGTFAYDAIVQQPDYSKSPLAAIFSTAMSRDPANGLGAARIWWVIANLGNGVAGDWVSAVSPFISANAFPPENAVCPKAYVNRRGGCITS
jgi:hypothetical protein